MASKAQVSYVLILPQALLAVLDVSSAVHDLLLGALRRALLVRSLSSEQTTGLGWVREGIARVDLPGESLIQRSHNTGPVLMEQLRACQRWRRLSATSAPLLFGSIGLLRASRENRWQAATFHLLGQMEREREKDTAKTLVYQTSI